MELLYNGLDTLEFSTQEFYVNDTEIFNKAKEDAKGLIDKQYPFEYEFYGKGLINDKAVEIKGDDCFIMRSTSYNPFSWSFYDKERNFLFSSVFSDSMKNFKVRILAKAFLIKELDELLGELQEILNVFGIDVASMKIRRIDWATDLSFNYKKMQKFIRDSYFTKCFFTKYGSLRSPVSVVPYTQDFGDKIYCTGIMVGSKAVKLRIYDKVLEAIQKYKEDITKNNLVLEAYYPLNEIKDGNLTWEKSQLPINIWMECMLGKYVEDKYQVVRFEYQFRDKYLQNKFKYVSDLSYEELKSLVFSTYRQHTGIDPEYTDRDFKFYEDSIGSTAFFHNKYKKKLPTLDGRINHSIVKIGSGLSSLGIALSEKYEKVVPYKTIKNVLRRHENFFYSKHYEKMYLNSKLIFSQEGMKKGILDFVSFEDYLLEYQKGILK
jgi:hypothetical protein